MYRRDFLKIGGLLSTVLLVQFTPLDKFRLAPMQAEAHGNYYSATSDGRILISANAGKTWQLHTDFGRDLSILGLSTDFGGQLHAQLEFAGHPFELALVQNSRTWKTA